MSTTTGEHRGHALRAQGTPRPHSVGASILLHLTPGAAAMVVYVVLTPVVRAWGLPSVAALALSAMVGVAPVQLVLLRVHRRRLALRGEPVIWLRARTTPGRTALWGGCVALVGGGLFVLGAPLSAWIQTTGFGWWPAHWMVELGTSGDYSRSSLLVTALLMLAGTVVVAPVVEELFFRGFLLPRVPVQSARRAALAHAALFGAYHLWTPWMLPSRLLAILPLVYVAARTGSVRPGIAAHATLNAIDLVVLTEAILVI